MVLWPAAPPCQDFSMIVDGPGHRGPVPHHGASSDSCTRTSSCSPPWQMRSWTSNQACWRVPRTSAGTPTCPLLAGRGRPLAASWRLTISDTEPALEQLLIVRRTWRHDLAGIRQGIIQDITSLVEEWEDHTCEWLRLRLSTVCRTDQHTPLLLYLLWMSSNQT